ncbi:TM2 domain-containing protein [Desmospora profundinema]|uniref:TM2 domain-containing membrane protein YozV n=1 Tax=Desmospora profundinema TaxID=1571184 RepID=A0ABU1IM01_9BACL|nr:TM2 domain-containing protein [Desmospora profundinema]MDR6225773.1 TM2 domain-containing membrane protein YozV [Desmospora profundinema]
MTDHYSNQPPASGREPATAEESRRERTMVAYVLWLFLGVFGAHRFYLGRWVTGLVMAAAGMITLTVGILTYLVTGSPLSALLPLFLWWLLDAFLMPRWIAELFLSDD